MDIHSMVLDEQPELVWNSLDETDEEDEKRIQKDEGEVEVNEDEVEDEEEEDDWKTATDEMISIAFSCTEHESSEIEDDVI